MAHQYPYSGSRAKNRLSIFSSFLFPAIAVLALALSACSGGTNSSGLATLVDTASTAEMVPESDAKRTASTTTSTSEATETPPEANIEKAEAGVAIDERLTEVAAQPALVESDQNDTDASLEEEDEALSDEESLLRFADCMRSNGVDLPDPIIEADGTVRFGIRPGTNSTAEFQGLSSDSDLPAAGEACAHLLQGVSFGATSDSFEFTELQDSLLEFARCMRDNGLDVGDPDLRNFGPSGGGDDGRSGGPVIQVWELSGSENDSPNGGPFDGLDFQDPDVAAALEECQAEANFGQFGVGAPRSNP